MSPVLNGIGPTAAACRRTAAARRQALDKIVAKLDEESKLCKDFVDDIEYDSIEFIQSAGELLTEGQ